MLFNKARAQLYMRQCKLDAMIATSPVNIGYLSGYFCWLDSTAKSYMLEPGRPSTLALPGYAVFPAEGESAAVLPAAFAFNAADLWVRDIHVFGNAGFDTTLTGDRLPDVYRRFHALVRQPAAAASAPEALIEIIRQRKLGDARLGLEIEGMPAAALEAIRGALPRAQLLDCTNLLRLIRMVKSEEEIRRLTQAAKLAEEGMQQSLAQARPGISLPQLANSFREGVAGGGADFEHFCIGPRGLGMITEPDYRLNEDDILFVDYGCIYQHYYSDSGLTLALTELSGPLRHRYEALHACVMAGRSAVRPGTPSSVVRGAMWSELKSRGFTASFPHGHGIGLEVRDYPILVADNGLRIRDDCLDVPSDLPLEANMVINLESSMFMPGVASLHIEHSFVVTEGGCHLLTTQDREAPYSTRG